MTTTNTRRRRTFESGQPKLDGQTVVVIGGSSGIGPDIARLARRANADVGKVELSSPASTTPT